jgi:hypothetical protein
VKSLLFQNMSRMGFQLGTESVGAYETTNFPYCLAPSILRPSGSARDEVWGCGLGVGSRNEKDQASIGWGGKRDLSFQIFPLLNYIHKLSWLRSSVSSLQPGWSAEKHTRLSAGARRILSSPWQPWLVILPVGCRGRWCGVVGGLRTRRGGQRTFHSFHPLPVLSPVLRPTCVTRSILQNVKFTQGGWAAWDWQRWGLNPALSLRHHFFFPRLPAW